MQSSNITTGVSVNVLANPYDCEDGTTREQIQTLLDRGVKLTHQCGL